MGAQRQLDFGDGHEAPAREETFAGLKLSYSRRESLEQCTRRYFFLYYGRSVEDRELRAKIQFLKGIKNRHLRIGELIHLVIGTYFKKLKDRKRVAADGLTTWARELFQQDQIYSEHIRRGGTATKQPFPPATLDEIVNEQEAQSEIMAQSEQQLLKALDRFFISSTFAEFRTLGVSVNSHIERKFSLDGYPGVVTGKIDLAAPNEHGVTIVDWKTGSASDGGAESLQLAMYGMWAMAEFGIAPESVRIAKAHLVTEEIVEFGADGQAFANARARILQDFERMGILHGYGKTGTIEAFTPNPHPAVCRLCPFRKLCPEGEVAVND